MRVLIISHNIFSNTESMGKTLSSFFRSWPKDDIAQLYFHSEIPTTHICKRYFRITDVDVLRRILGGHRCGQELSDKDIHEDLPTSRTDSGITARIYQYARKRTPIIYWLRNLIWKRGRWYTPELGKWLHEFKPDCIFFASGDYAFAYRVAKKIATELSIPIVVYCCDDYYLSKVNGAGKLYEYNYCELMNTVTDLMTKTKHIICICSQMARCYQSYFGIPASTILTGAGTFRVNEKRENRIVYIGGLGCKRVHGLIDLGRALLRMNGVNWPKMIDVYSSERRAEIVNLLTENNGIRFHGAVSAESVKELYETSRYAIHTESFDEEMRQKVRFSISTKIADMLASGVCIVAYGPKGIASMDYLEDNKSACVIHHNQDIITALIELFGSDTAQRDYISKAKEMASKNHDTIRNGRMVAEILEKVVQTEEGVIA